ncbi:2'-5' RNA ligase family protein [Frigoribacterium sp. 2-23]|uniref:2'-5' RNA ligase family protein n=1 Tax=Frigoribacterium sp. 2-23 TaxID=3415006 RepID=UPI003C6EC436
MHSIELLLDDATDAAIRAEWAALAAAGLPSQQNHAGESNAPHVTLLARPLIEPVHDEALRELFASPALPLAIELGSLLVFGAPPRGLVLVRPVVVSAALLELHRAAHRAAPVAATAPDARHTTPDHWTPHVTLAHRLTPEQLAAAIETLDAVEPIAPPTDGGDARSPRASAVQARRWDSTERTITTL